MKPAKTCLGPLAGQGCPNKVQVTGARKRCKRCVESYKKVYALERYHLLHGNPGKAIKASAGQKERRPAGSPRLRQKPTSRVAMPDSKDWACKVCGCTEDHGCWPYCWWVEKELCSSCASAEQIFVHQVALRMGQLAELFTGLFKLPEELRVKNNGAGRSRHTR